MAVLAAGCTGSSGGRHTPTTSKPPSPGVVLDHPPALQPITFGPQLWSGTDGGPFPVVTGGVIHGNSTVLLGGDEANWEDRLAVVDTVTGRPAWRIGNLDHLPGGGGTDLWVPAAPNWPFVVGTGADWSVLVEYIRDHCAHPSGFCPRSADQLTEEFGVAALSGRDGSVRWSTPIVAAVPSESAAADRDPISTLVGADDTTALVSVYDRPRLSTDPARPPTTVALDVRTGKQLWRRSGMTPQTLAGDTVLAWQTSAPPPTAGQPGPATLAALDAATGRLRWRWPAKLTLGSPLVVAGGLVAITTIAAPRLSVLVVDLATGKKVTTLANGAGTCVADDRSGDKSLVACAVGDDRGYHLATLRAGDHRLAISKAPIPDAMLHRVWQGYVFAASGSMRGDIAIDDAANTLSVDVPGDVVDIDGRYAIFSFYRTADHRHGYVVRRIVR